MIVSTAINRSLCMFVCLFVCLAGGVFLCSVENFYCLSSYSTILTELRALVTAGKALIYAAVYVWESTFAASKILQYFTLL